MIMNLKKHLLVATTIAATMLSQGCKKDGGSTPKLGSYPKTVNVEYRITSSSGLPFCDVLYTNATGGRTSVDSATLPYSVKFSRTVNAGDLIGVLGSYRGGGSLTPQILVDGQVVKTETFTAGSTIVSGSIAYSFY